MGVEEYATFVCLARFFLRLSTDGLGLEVEESKVGQERILGFEAQFKGPIGKIRCDTTRYLFLQSFFFF